MTLNLSALGLGNVGLSTVEVTLDDGRIVRLEGSGRIAVYLPVAHELGAGESYSLELPSVGYVATHCDAQNDVMNHGHATIEVEHRQ